MQSSKGIYEQARMDAVEDWFKAILAASQLLLDEANQLVFTGCDGKEVTPNEKIRRLELLTACVRHNARLAIRAEKLRAEFFKDPPEHLKKYQAYIEACEKILLNMPKTGF